MITCNTFCSFNFAGVIVGYPKEQSSSKSYVAKATPTLQETQKNLLTHNERGTRRTDTARRKRTLAFHLKER